MTVQNGWNLDGHTRSMGMALTVQSAGGRSASLGAPTHCNVALNQRDGRMAVFVDGTLSIYAPDGGCGLKEVLRQNLVRGQHLTVANAFKSGDDQMRVRFVYDTIYLFHPPTRRGHVLTVNTVEGTVSLVQTLFDPYFAEAKITDILVT